MDGGLQRNVEVTLATRDGSAMGKLWRKKVCVDEKVIMVSYGGKKVCVDEKVIMVCHFLFASCSWFRLPAAECCPDFWGRFRAELYTD